MFSATESSSVAKLRLIRAEPLEARPAVQRAGDERPDPTRLAQAALEADCDRQREQSTFRARFAAALCRCLSVWTTSRAAAPRPFDPGGSHAHFFCHF